MLIDSHCHLDRVDLRPYGGDFHRLMAATRAAGVGHMLCVSIDLERYPRMRELVAPYPQVSASVGVHPSEQGRREPTPDELVALARDPRVVAIGETGLDYYRGTGDLGRQHQRFRNQIAAAGSCGKPLIVHSREAREDTLRILTEEDARDVGGVLHCFTETWEMAKAALDLGFYISFSGIITFKTADKLRAVAAQVPRDRLLIETDSPYLAPVPHRGKPNEPGFVAVVAQCIAELRGISTEALAELTRDNFFRLFRDAVPTGAAGSSRGEAENAKGGSGESSSCIAMVPLYPGMMFTVFSHTKPPRHEASFYPVVAHPRDFHLSDHLRTNALILNE